MRKKFEIDVEILGPFKYLLEEAVDLSRKINEGEAEIHQSLEILKKKQDEVGNFIIDVNRIKSNAVSSNREH